MTTPRRPAGYGRIDRDRPLTFSFDGTRYQGYAGDTLASALLGAGLGPVARSIREGRPRGIMAAGTEEPNALVQVSAPFHESMIQATTVELVDGLVAHSLAGLGRLSADADPARYDAVHDHPDVLVVGAGPAGLSAALAATRAGARVVLVETTAELGGALLGATDRIDGRPAAEWVTAVTAELEAAPETRILRRTTAFGVYDDGFVLAVERRTDHLRAADPDQARHRIWRLRCRTIVVAAGAHERPIAFTNNDRPGIMLADSARTYLHRFGVLPGERAVVFTATDSAYLAAVELADAGVTIAQLVDAREQPPRALAEACAERGIAVRAGSVVTGTAGTDRLTSVQVAGSTVGELRTGIDADLLLVSGGWNPAVHLLSQAGGRLRYDQRVAAFVPDGEDPEHRVLAAGSAAGLLALADCLESGTRAGRRAATAAGFDAADDTDDTDDTDRAEPPRADQVAAYRVQACWQVPDRDGLAGRFQYVDLQRDATVADLQRAAGAGLRSPEHVKRYTTIGTAHDQGKTSGLVSSALLGALLGQDLARVGLTRYRPPYLPVQFAALAGRDRGPVLNDPVRVTPLDAWHEAAGAVWENVGQWRRPRYYPVGTEDLDAAVDRECRAARGSVAMMDASTLGKIEVNGPDAPAFMDLLYTNLMSTLKVGSVRYGLMLGLDGMVLDDGTVMRLAEERYLLSTTTGNAALVLEWMEEWLQTEWPQLRVWLTSVTEQWATIAVVGPHSRAVVGQLAPSLDVDNDAFGFMTWRDTEVAGAPARVARISFSGELAYELNIPGWYAEHVWERLLEVGAAFDLQVYGTETMHVLRAEKGYPIIGQDTDGTVTPQDLGMSWVVSKKKRDFIGKRSHARADNQRADRKQLVALLPRDPNFLIDEGAQIIAEDALTKDGRGAERAGGEPVQMLGQVTSSYRSAALGRTFALALVSAGRERVGDTLLTWSAGEAQPVTVAESVVFDPEGTRRDG